MSGVTRERITGNGMGWKSGVVCEEGEREREGETGRTFFTIQRIYLRALFVHVIPATYKAFLPLSVVKIQREN